MAAQDKTIAAQKARFDELSAMLQRHEGLMAMMGAVLAAVDSPAWMARITRGVLGEPLAYVSAPARSALIQTSSRLRNVAS